MVVDAPDIPFVDLCRVVLLYGIEGLGDLHRHGRLAHGETSPNLNDSAAEVIASVLDLPQCGKSPQSLEERGDTRIMPRRKTTKIGSSSRRFPDCSSTRSLSCLPRRELLLALFLPKCACTTPRARPQRLARIHRHSPAAWRVTPPPSFPPSAFVRAHQACSASLSRSRSLAGSRSLSSALPRSIASMASLRAT